MGVKGLQTLMKKNNLLTPICFREEVDRCCRYYGDYATPVSVAVDTPSLLHNWYGDLPWIYGGQWYELLQKIRQFIHQFESIHIKLVFFFDGSVEKNKRPTWCKRRMAELEDNKKLFDNLLTGNGSLPMTRSNVHHLPPNMLAFVKMMLKYNLHQTLLISIGEGDRAIAEYACRNQCLSILSDDSDFVIYDTVPCYSANMLDTHSMRTYCYDRHKLCHFLGISAMCLPILAVLSGNDIITPQQLAFFHRNIKPQQAYNTSAICDVAHFLYYQYIAQWPYGQGLDCPSLVWRLESDIPELTRLQLSSAVAGYQIPVYRDEAEFVRGETAVVGSKRLHRVSQLVFDTIITDHIYCNVLNSVLGVVCGEDSDVSTSAEDIRTGLLPYGDVYEALRCRLYGFVLEVTPGESADGVVALTEWNMSSLRANPHHPQCIYPQPIYVNGSVCGAHSVWFGACRDAPSAVHAFWQLMGVRSPDVGVIAPASLAALYCPLAALHYLLTTPASQPLQWWELRVLLCHIHLTLHSFTDDRTDTIPDTCHDLAGVEHTNARAVHVATLLCRGIGYAMNALALCRLQRYIADNIPWRYFNGYHFHRLYVKAATRAEPHTVAIEELVDNNINIRDQVKQCEEFLEKLTK